MQPEEIIRSVKDIYTHNAFMQHCGIKVHSISCGKAAVGLRIDPAIHTNLNGKLHEGLLTTLVDNATGIACAGQARGYGIDDRRFHQGRSFRCNGRGTG